MRDKSRQGLLDADLVSEFVGMLRERRNVA
jgi:hypothetical protein